MGVGGGELGIDDYRRFKLESTRPLVLAFVSFFSLVYASRPVRWLLLDKGTSSLADVVGASAMALALGLGLGRAALLRASIGPWVWLTASSCSVWYLVVSGPNTLALGRETDAFCQ